MRVRLRLDRLLQKIAEGRLSQNHWAIKLGISRGHWSAILSGRYPYPSPKTRQQMLEVFGVPFEELFEIVSGPQGDADATFQAALADRYLIDREIGQGGMGTVYLARDVTHGRTVAVKVISPEAVGGIGIPQFLKETRLAARLQHPNILPIYDSGEAAGFPYYVTPYIERGSLRDLLREDGALLLPTVLRIAHHVAQALQHAHDRHVLHCDVKPENILLVGRDENLHAYVSDFGIARAVHAEALEWRRRGEIDSSAGTPAYVSPEQASGESQLQPASDVYSFGCVLFEMLVGKPPFRGTTTMETVAQRFVGPAPDLRRAAPRVPPALAAVVGRAMALDPAHRFATVEALNAAVQLSATEQISGYRMLVARAMAPLTHVARRLFGSRPSTRRYTFMDRLAQDLAYALRSLWRRPAYAIVVLLTLALGIGMNTAIFSVLHGVLFRPLPFPDSEEIVRVGRTRPELPGVLLPISPANFVDLRPQVRSLRALEADVPRSLVLSEGDEPASYPARAVTPGYLDVFGVAPQLGRTFVEEDGRVGAPAVVVIADDLWRTRLGANPNIVGTTLRLSDETRTVIGVMPRDLSIDNAQMWIPFQWTEANLSVRNNNFLRLYGRLTRDMTPEQAITELHGLWTRLGQQHQESYDESGMSAMPLRAAVVERMRNPLLILSGAVGFVLLIACANVANLMLARTETRRSEIAVRAALGAGRGRLARQFLTESVLTSLIGGAVGVVVAFLGVQALLAAFASAVPRAGEIGINWTILSFSMAVSVVTGLLVGVVPAVQARPDVASLKEGARGGSGKMTWLRKGLVVSEIALALMLVAGAGLMLKSFWQALRADLGFEDDNLVIATLWFPPSRYQESSTRKLFVEQVTARLRAHPEVAALGMTDLVPIQNFGTNVTRLDVVGAPEREATFVEIRRTTPEYFRAMGIPLLTGRMFTDDDATADRQVTIINQELARRLFGDEVDPVGQQLNRDAGREIIGVVGNVRQFGPDQLPRPEFYLPADVALSMVVRARGESAAAIAAIRQTASAIDPAVVVTRFETMDDIVSRALGGRRFQLTLIGIFALAALALGAVGIYGVMTYTVAGQTREIGVRMALGARTNDVLRMILWRGAQLTIAGVALGAIGAFALRRVIANLLFDVSAFDPSIYAAVSALLVSVAMVACFLPARRAAAVHPVEALRQE